MARAKKTKKDSMIWKWVLGVSGGMILVLVLVLGIVWWVKEGSKTDLGRRGLPDRGVPVMEISLADGLELSEIDEGSKETRYEGNKVTMYEKGEATEYSDVEVKGRGNTTWQQDKKPYQIKFSKSVDLLGLGRAKKWVLLANYLDASYLRNDIAFTLAEMLGIKYNHRGDFVELYVDGDYRGLYYVMQKIEISKYSVDLRKSDGLLFEMDNLHKKDNEECYVAYFGECLILKDSVVEDEERIDSLATDFLKDFDSIEMSAERKDYDSLKEYGDVDDFAKYFLLNEFSSNPDAYSTSLYLYRNDDGKIAAGPAWDFDLAFANSEWWQWTEETLFIPREKIIEKKKSLDSNRSTVVFDMSELFYHLMEMPEFQNEAVRVFQEKMSGREQELMQTIKARAEKIYMAAKIDGKRWERRDFEKELSEILDWIQGRYEYFEEIYGSSGATRTGVV